MRILVISQFYTPDITAAAFRISDMAAKIADAGHEICVLTARPHKARVSDDGVSQPEHPNVRVTRCAIKPVTGGGTKAYVRHYMSFVRSSIAAGVKLRLRGWKPDVVWVSSPPLFVGISARALSLLFRRPMVLEVRDIWPDSAVAAGQLSAEGRAYRIGRKLERYLYGKARRITCVSKPMAEYISGYTDQPVEVVYNGVPDDAVAVARAQRPPVRSGGSRTLLYAGNIGHVQTLELLVRVFVEQSRAGALSGWRVRLIGEGAQKGNLERLLVSLDAGDLVSLEPAVPRSRAFEEMCRADVLYLDLKKDPVLAKTIPSKLFDYLLAGRPIVAGLAGEGREILSATCANLCFEPENPDQLAEVLRRMAGRFDELDDRAEANRHIVLERFTRSEAADRLLQVLNEVASR